MNLIHSREKGYVFKLPILTLCYPATTFYRLATPTCFVKGCITIKYENN